MTLSLIGYLKFLRGTYLRDFSGASLTIVCGNQSADLDSVVSSLAYAYLNYVKYPQIPIIPIINIPKQDLKLRKDIIYVLNKTENIASENDLFFIEDIQQLKSHFKGVNIEAILVDHNKPQGQANDIIDSVIGIIDHHEDMKISRENIKKFNGPDIIQVAGSCSSLVTNYWVKQLGNVDALKPISELCLSAVLIDTANMKFKVETPDIEALKVYKATLPPTYGIEQFYTDIKKNKDNLDGLSLYDIVRKDYKEFNFEYKSKNVLLNVGIAAIVKPVPWLLTKFGIEDFQKTSSEFGKHLDVFIILTSFNNSKGQYEREFLIMGSKNEILDQIQDKLADKLELRKVSNVVPAVLNVRLFNQLNTKASRKQIAPYIEEALCS
ncbi:related to Exopolyphosphatase [Saccharomycodes ludwigii]|uniref:Related to Exopolyphosphatase n=1 Tax=Saccharomycodes ludwigii TaxID=36035 RepID=A0A376B206_9ASCO|nr:related to Exopolyphosphatase [Saccharomycodes ludwigii]